MPRRQVCEKGETDPNPISSRSGTQGGAERGEDEGESGGKGNHGSRGGGDSE